MSGTLTDEEFGTIRIKRMHRAKHLRLRVNPDGALVATLPKYAPLYLIKRLVDSSRLELRRLFREQPATAIHPIYSHGDQIGASHRLVIRHSTDETSRVRLIGQLIVVELSRDGDSTRQTDIIRQGVAKALRKEAQAHLPRRLAYLAAQYGFTYRNIRFTNAKSRWGSCSSGGIISLNIALMRLEPDLIDYVLIHELCHTIHMNHSAEFWETVGKLCPAYVAHRRTLKRHSPYL